MNIKITSIATNSCRDTQCMWQWYLQSATQSNSPSRAFGGLALTGASSDPCGGVPAWKCVQQPMQPLVH